jgi:WD40 repeat protein
VDADKGKQKARFDSTWEAITDAELSHDGNRLATCAGQVAMLWDVQAQQPVWKFKPNSRKALIWSSITFSPDERSVLLGNHPQEHRPTLRRYSVDTGELVEQFTSQQWSPPVALSLNRDGSSLAIAYGGFDRTVMLWNVERNEPLRWVGSTDKAAGMIKEVKLSHDGQRLAVAINDRLELRNLAKSTVHSVPLGRSGSVEIGRKTTVVGFGVGHTALSADGTLAAATGHGGRMAVWDVDRGQELKSESQELGDLQLAYGSGILFGPDARAVVWSIRGKGGQRTLSTPLARDASSEQWQAFFATQDITLDGKRVIGRDEKSRQSSIDFANRRSICSLPQAIEKTALAPAAARWFAIKQASVVAEYSLDGCQELRQFDIPKAKLRAITASGDGNVLAMLDGSSAVRLLDTRSGQTVAIVVDGRAWSVYKDDQLLRSSTPTTF